MRFTLGVCIIVMAVAVATSNSQAALQAYWNMDANSVDGKEPANSGAQISGLTADFKEISVGFLSDIDPLTSGTTTNIIGSSSSNRSVGFYRAGTAYAAGSFRMDNFDFTGLSDVSISFAYQSFDTFTWDTNLEVDYRIDDGAWIDIAEGQTWTSGWRVADIGFGSALDNQSDVDLRIATQSWGSAIGYLDIDNVQVWAVPEPSTILLALAGAVLVLRRRRNFTKS